MQVASVVVYEARGGGFIRPSDVRVFFAFGFYLDSHVDSQTGDSFGGLFRIIPVALPGVSDLCWWL